MSNHLTQLFGYSQSAGDASGQSGDSDKLNLRNELQVKRASRKTARSRPISSYNTSGVSRGMKSQFFTTSNGRGSMLSQQSALPQSAQQQAQQQQQKISNEFVSSSLKFKIPNFSKLPALELATEFINGVNKKDDDVPALNEVFTKYEIDNYNFKPSTGLQNFVRFEKIAILNIPDEILKEYTNTKCKTSMGIFPELNKSWLTVDNKLILWDYEDISNAKYSTIDEIKHTILAVKLIKPKKGVFVDSVNYLLLVSTPMDIYILAIEFDPATKKMDIFNTGMNVSTQGLIVNNFITFDKTNDIFFTGIGDGINIWKLTYSNKQDWFTNKCSKECLTRSGLSTILPDSLGGLFQNSNSIPAPNSIKHEYITQLEMDQSRGILYTLSSKSTVRAYKLRIDKQNNITTPTEISKTTNDILKDLSTTVLNLQSSLLNRKTFAISKIFPVTNTESNNVYLIVVLTNGVRIYLNGAASFASFGASSTTSDFARLTANFVKFPPADFSFFEKAESRASDLKKAMENNLTTTSNFNTILTKDQVLQQQQQQQQQQDLYTPLELKNAQENSNLLKVLKTSRIISPGIFFGVVKSETNKNEDKLFVSTPDYGVLKRDRTYIEDFEFLDTFGSIHDIIPLTLQTSKNCNLFASQYVTEPLRVAILTNSGIHIYKYKTPDLILEDSLDDLIFKEFCSKYGSEEGCSTALYLACKFGKPETFKQRSTQLFIHGGKNGNINENLTSILDNVELSDRFFASTMLVSRLFKDLWDKELFKVNDKVVAFDRSGYVDEAQLVKKLKEVKEQPIVGLNLSKENIEYLLSSILIICEFFEKNSSKIPGLSSSMPSFSSFELQNDRNLEITLQAENIAFKALLQFLDSVKEALSFLIVLFEERDSQNGFQEIFQYLSIQTQLDLSCLTLQEFLAPKTEYIKQLIKEILSAIINKNISKGSSVEFITSSLQERCGTFCSSDDVIIYKAIENFKKAKELYLKDFELSRKYLSTAIKLFEKCDEKNLNFDIVQNCVDIMIEMRCHEVAIEFLLNLSVKEPRAAKQSFYNSNDKQIMLQEANAKKMKLYELIFKILIDVESKAMQSLQSINSQVTELTNLRDLSYSKCFNFKNQNFQFELYKFLIDQNSSDKLLDVDSDYILPFLEEYSSNDINIAYLLCNYHLKRSNYLEAANILVSITIAFEDLNDETKIQLLCKAKVYLNAADSTNNSRKLSAAIDELINSLVSDV